MMRFVLKLSIIVVTQFLIECSMVDAATITFDSMNSPITPCVYLNPASQGGTLLAVLDTATQEGTVHADLTLDQNGDGSLQILSSQLVMSDLLGQVVAIDDLGTFTMDLKGVTFDLQMSVPVHHYHFALTDASPAARLFIDNGFGSLYNITGTLASILPSYSDVDFSRIPFEVELTVPRQSGTTGIVDDGNGPNGPLPSIGLLLGGLETRSFQYAAIAVYVQFDLNIQQSVPEASTIALIGSALPLILSTLKRARRTSTR